MSLDILSCKPRAQPSPTEKDPIQNSSTAEVENACCGSTSTHLTAEKTRVPDRLVVASEENAGIRENS